MSNFTDSTWEWSVHNIQKQFFCCWNLKLFCWQGVFELLVSKHHGLQYQKEILESTIKHPLNETHPVKFSYQKSFVKYICNTLETSQSEVHEEFYNSLVTLLQKQDNPTHFHHYYLPSHNIVSVEENTNLISDGTTGLHSWQAAFALADYCLQNKNMFENKSVLELGSGIGLTGIMLVCERIVSKCIFSDCHPSVLKLLCSNIELNLKKNFVNCKTEEVDTGVLLHFVTDSLDVQVKNLPWCDIKETIIDEISADFLIAADVVFDMSNFNDLTSAIKNCLSKKSVKGIIACTVRNSKTLTEFINQLISLNLNVRDSNFIKSNTFLYDSQTEIKIFEVSS